MRTAREFEDRETVNVTLRIVEHISDASTVIEFRSNGSWTATLTGRSGQTTVIPTAIVRYWWPAKEPEGATLLLRTRDVIYRLPVTRTTLAVIAVELTKRLGEKGYPVGQGTPR